MAIDAPRPRAPYACDPRNSRGRLYPEPESPNRNVFRRDCDRIIHSTAFRRLKHKTQVFVVHEGDHYRTRLTHSLEVAQIARSLARALGLDEDLTEALALAHDLGHPPFGHAGESALQEAMREYGGFDHNAQTLRVITELEGRYADFDGLNLTCETLEGLLKHNGPFVGPDGQPSGRYKGRDIPQPFLQVAELAGVPLETRGTAEAQIAAIADDIAYDAHDLDDGLRAGLFALDDLLEVPLVGDLLREIHVRHPALEEGRAAHELVRRVITRMIEDVTSASSARINLLAPQTPDDLRNVDEEVIGFSAAFLRADAGIKSFLFPHMYRSEQVVQVMNDAKQVVLELFAMFLARPDRMPANWNADFDKSDDRRRARRVCDYIAGMTDTYAVSEHSRMSEARRAVLG
ncbi:MAG: dGTPase [Variibacter sp.]|nr:dGTPase [Variibacter sp.]